jgi:hypothetical protein
MALMFPTVVLFIANYDEWVISGESTKIALGVMLGILYALLVMKGALKEISPKIATLLSMFTFLAIIWFLDSMIEDLFWVVASVILGYIFYIFVSTIGSKYLHEYNVRKDEIIKQKVVTEIQKDVGNV